VGSDVPAHWSPELDGPGTGEPGGLSWAGRDWRKVAYHRGAARMQTMDRTPGTGVMFTVVPQ